MQDQALTSLRDLAYSAAAYLPTLFAGVFVLLLGLVAAWAASKLLVRVLILMRLDRVLARLHWTEALESGDARHSLFEFLGVLLGIFIFLIFLANALVIWQLTVLSNLLGRFVELIPELISAAIVLAIGWGVAVGVSRNVQRTLYQEGVGRARLIARLVRWGILMIIIAIALIELRIAVELVTGTFLIAFGALALTLVLAVGLGSKRGIELMWEERFRLRREQERERTEPPAARR
jgi:hypothetical protein